MTVKATPRLRIALLNWFLDDNEPLAGDLIEECAHRSRRWFWRQLMFALLATNGDRRGGGLARPARLVARSRPSRCSWFCVFRSSWLGAFSPACFHGPEWPAMSG